MITHEQTPSATPTSPWRGWDRWLRLLGVAVSVGGGVVLSLPTAVPLAVVLVLPLVVGVVSAALMRSWWALLIVPVAFRVGFLLIGIPLAGGFDVLARSSPGGIVEVSTILVGLQLVPVALGMAIGVPIGKQLEQRLQQ
jgi:Na+-transporting methylmalonyl-CoA/oxaloacetate decarboxylase beta subunit